MTCRCMFCLDPIPLVAKAGRRSKAVADPECQYCLEIRNHEQMDREVFMRVILRPGKIAADNFWLIWARRLSNYREMSGGVREAAE